jgi:hypothetical protein
MRETLQTVPPASFARELARRATTAACGVLKGASSEKWYRPLSESETNSSGQGDGDGHGARNDDGEVDEAECVVHLMTKKRTKTHVRPPT